MAYFNLEISVRNTKCWYSQSRRTSKGLCVCFKKKIWNLPCWIHNSTAASACSKQCFLLAGVLCIHANDKTHATLERVVCDRRVSVLIKKTLFPFIYMLKIVLQVFLKVHVLVPISRFCHSWGDIFWSSNHCQQQLIEESKLSLPCLSGFRVFCSVCHRAASNSSNLNLL